MEWFLYEWDLRHERVKHVIILRQTTSNVQYEEYTNH